MTKEEQIEALENNISNAQRIAAWRRRNGFEESAKDMQLLIENLKEQLKKLEE